MATYKRSGAIVNYTPATDVTAGSIFSVGALIVVAKRDVKAGELGAFDIYGEFHDVPKKTGNALTLGQVVFFNPTDNLIYNASATGRIPCGYAIEAAQATDAVCKIILMPSVVVAKSAPAQ